METLEAQLSSRELEQHHPVNENLELVDCKPNQDECQVQESCHEGIGQDFFAFYPQTNKETWYYLSQNENQSHSLLLWQCPKEISPHKLLMPLIPLEQSDNLSQVLRDNGFVELDFDLIGEQEFEEIEKLCTELNQFGSALRKSPETRQEQYFELEPETHIVRATILPETSLPDYQVTNIDPQDDPFRPVKKIESLEQEEKHQLFHFSLLRTETGFELINEDGSPLVHWDLADPEQFSLYATLVNELSVRGEHIWATHIPNVNILMTNIYRTLGDPNILQVGKCLGVEMKSNLEELDILLPIEPADLDNSSGIEDETLNMPAPTQIKRTLNVCTYVDGKAGNTDEDAEKNESENEIKREDSFEFELKNLAENVQPGEKTDWIEHIEPNEVDTKIQADHIKTEHKSLKNHIASDRITSKIDLIEPIIDAEYVIKSICECKTDSLVSRDELIIQPTNVQCIEQPAPAISPPHRPLQEETKESHLRRAESIETEMPLTRVCPISISQTPTDECLQKISVDSPKAKERPSAGSVASVRKSYHLPKPNLPFLISENLQKPRPKSQKTKQLEPVIHLTHERSMYRKNSGVSASSMGHTHRKKTAREEAKSQTIHLQKFEKSEKAGIEHYRNERVMNRKSRHVYEEFSSSYNKSVIPYEHKRSVNRKNGAVALQRMTRRADKIDHIKLQAEIMTPRDTTESVICGVLERCRRQNAWQNNSNQYVLTQFEESVVPTAKIRPLELALEALSAFSLKVDIFSKSVQVSLLNQNIYDRVYFAETAAGFGFSFSDNLKVSFELD
ncbi:hypothetical protein HYW32_01350 [Candidatus Berkelbacteria bacterium]|nr:hypothetical protein [Candidatus Berkelbacteria bacterium]